MTKFLCIFILIFSYSLCAQETVIEGNIGIGTSPITTLHIGNSASTSKLLFENGGDILWKNTTGVVRSVLSYHSDDHVYLDTGKELIFRSDSGEKARILEDGGFIVNDGPLELINLGNTDSDKGIIFAEDQNSAFGLVYDGRQLNIANKIHFREYFGTATNIMTLKGNGNIGIGDSDPINTLTIEGDEIGGVAGFTRSDLGGNKSHILHGNTGDWYIRPSLNTGKIIIADGGGNIGIGKDNPINTLDIEGLAPDGVAGFKRSDLGGRKSHVLYGDNGDWYIRPSLSSGKIIIADHGGNVGIGTSAPNSTLEVDGKVNIADDSNTPNKGDIRFNSSNDDFEGFDGVEWYSLTNNKKKVYTLNIGAGQIMIDREDDEDFDINRTNGYSTFVTNTGGTGYMYCPLILPVGSKIIEITYNYSDVSPTDDMSFQISRYNRLSNGRDVYYQFTSSDISLNGFETHTITADHVIADNYYYTFVFTFRRSSGDWDQQKLQGIQVKYELP